jgi:hypothetical protein
MAEFRLNTSGVLLQARRARKNPNPWSAALKTLSERDAAGSGNPTLPE